MFSLSCKDKGNVGIISIIELIAHRGLEACRRPIASNSLFLGPESGYNNASASGASSPADQLSAILSRHEAAQYRPRPKISRAGPPREPARRFPSPRRRASTPAAHCQCPRSHQSARLRTPADAAALGYSSYSQSASAHGPLLRSQGLLFPTASH
ncbi:hypothetical protein L226DRAFT_322343 [Lentinus tigrinus ALCF2SS1-7]|uniref:uncharacterized protein n=1 Tax=Lentinus tigrinus ALCF2SS1-7 TaxID=1328758 RepID=UPI00116633D1|nr:hypothetical protein L226DRAFT_322343 [Lentinus tigrinus ALCF2SS1-7]